MELTRKTLEDVKFHSRGKWYSGQEVDDFLEEMMLAADRQEEDLRAARREAEAVRGELRRVTGENRALREELERKNAEMGALKDLEQEHRALLEDIKALRRFRDTFREAVRKDAGELLAQTGALGSDKLV